MSRFRRTSGSRPSSSFAIARRGAAAAAAEEEEEKQEAEFRSRSSSTASGAVLHAQHVCLKEKKRGEKESGRGRGVGGGRRTSYFVAVFYFLLPLSSTLSQFFSINVLFFLPSPFRTPRLQTKSTTTCEFPSGFCVASVRERPAWRGGRVARRGACVLGGGGASESSMGAEQKERDRELDRLLKVQAAAKLFRPPATAPLGLASRFFSPTARAVGSPPGVRVGVETGKRQKAAGRARACSFFCARPSNLLVGRRRASMGALLEIEKKSHPNVASQRPCERSIGPHLSRDVWNLIFPRRRDRQKGFLSGGARSKATCSC